MSSTMNGIVSRAVAVALAAAPVLGAVALGALIDGHLSMAAAGKGDHGSDSGAGNSDGHGTSGDHNTTGVGASGAGAGNSDGNGASGDHNGTGVGASGAGSGNSDGNGASGDHTGVGASDAGGDDGSGDGSSASKGDVDGDGTPGRSGTQGIGQDVSEVASDDSTTGQDKAEAIRLINHHTVTVDHSR